MEAHTVVLLVLVVMVEVELAQLGRQMPQMELPTKEEVVVELVEAMGVMVALGLLYLDINFNKK